jgi:polysaccharide pyruvyl transferase CsaB
MIDTAHPTILLYGMYGAINVGDELVCRAVAEGIRTILPGSRICIRSISPVRSLQFNPLPGTEVAEGGGFHYTFWLHPFRQLSVYKKADAVVIGGGGLFQDQYGWRLAAGALLSALMGLIYKKPVYVLGVGAGPVGRAWLRRLIGRTLSQADVLCVRDEESRQELEDCGVPAGRITVTADVVPAMEIGKKQPADRDPDSRTAALILREWEGLNPAAAAALLDRLAAEGYTIQLHGFEPARDRQFYQNIVSRCDQRMEKSIRWVIPQTLQETLDALQSADVAISMRLHGCVLAVMLGIPLLPVVYERKVKAFAEQMDLTDWLKTTRDVNADLADQVEAVRRYWDDHRARIEARWDRIRIRSRQNFEQVKTAVSGEPSLDRPGKTGYFRRLLTGLMIRAMVGEVLHVFECLFKRIAKVR